MDISKLKPFDAVDYLETPEDVRLFVQEVFRDGSIAEILDAIETAVRATGLIKIAEQVRLDPDMLSKALDPEGCVEFAMVRKVLEALGMRLVAVPLGDPEPGTRA